MPRTLAGFLERFVLPLVRGGELAVGKPISLAELDAFRGELPHCPEELVAVDEARSDAVAELVVRPPALVFDEEELELAVALHNLLFLEHPVVDSWISPLGRLARVRETARQLAARPPAEDRQTLLARHGLLHNLFRLTRNDTLVSWWTGSKRYYGQRPARRLSRWPNLRRVSTQVNVARYSDLLGDPDVERVVGELMCSSPLTDLLAQPRPGPPLDWRFSALVLRDGELARGVAYAALARADGNVDQQLAAPASLAAAFERLADDPRADPADVRAVAAFLIHLNALLAEGEAGGRDADAPSPLLAAALSPERAAMRPRGLATFLALPQALALTAPELARPPGLADDPLVHQRWQRHRSQVAAAVEGAAVRALAERVGRALGGAVRA